ncbi:MAG: type II toxin-antitoxin system VapC family toxin [Chloroflexi bacterium]|nr:type II toxin-antitoxin system VapC family toxin [Chloroflexota bacterium]
MRYFDASALVKRCVREPGSQSIRQLMDSGPRATSRLSEVEVVSGIARLVRSGALSTPERDHAIATLDGTLPAMLVVELTSNITLRARALLERHRIRAGDAIQLASCLDLQDRLGQPVTMVSFDTRLTDSAAAEGLSLT